jgi:2-oxoacid:acceptor oxidoreductase delta subunit (pyruvate/2-ketoisovalerate family)
MSPRSRSPTSRRADRNTETALFEARCCLSCGNCFGVCPDNAVVKLDPAGAYGYAIDLDYCKGCGLCAAECPAGAIAMVPEAI